MRRLHHAIDPPSLLLVPTLPAAQRLLLLAWGKSYEQAGTPILLVHRYIVGYLLVLFQQQTLLCVLGRDTCRSCRLCWRYQLQRFAQRMMSDWSRLAAGGCGNSGRLDKEQQQLLKRYQTKLKIFGHPMCTAEVLQSVHISL